MIKKGAGRRPAPQNTRQESDDKRFRSNYRRRNRCKEQLATATQTETHMWLQKGLAAGKLHKIQNKNEMTRASDQTTGEATDVTRGLRQVHMQSHTCDYKSTRQEWDDKSFRLNHGRSNRCKEKLESATQTETHTCDYKGSWPRASSQKHKTRMRWQELQVKPQEKQQM